MSSKLQLLDSIIESAPDLKYSPLVIFLRQEIQEENTKSSSPRSKAANLAASMQGKFPICPKCK